MIYCIKMIKQLLNPRGYLSHSQIELWQKDREAYIRKYFYGEEDDKQNKFLKFGKKTAEAIENGDDGEDELVTILTTILSKYKKAEHKLTAKLKTSSGEVELLGILDTFDLESLKFREYKTGRIKWTQERANKSEQLRHYQALIYLNYKSLSPEIYLDWAETEDCGGEICLTGNIKSFKVIITMADVLEYLAKVMKIAQEIDREYRKELNLLK